MERYSVQLQVVLVKSKETRATPRATAALVLDAINRDIRAGALVFEQRRFSTGSAGFYGRAIVDVEVPAA